MIPKIIHYCWFGQHPLPRHNRECIQSWRRFCPDFKIIRWSEKNFRYHEHLFTAQAYRMHNWAAISDYVRLFVLRKMGGVYLDTDVRMIKPINPLLSHPAVIGMENSRAIASGLIFGATRDNPNVTALLKLYNRIAQWPGFASHLNDQVYITTAYFYQHGFQLVNQKQIVNHCWIYPTAYFCPHQLGQQRKLRTTRQTYTIHEYDGSWSHLRRDQRQRDFDHEFHQKLKFYLTQMK